MRERSQYLMVVRGHGTDRVDKIPEHQTARGRHTHSLLLHLHTGFGKEVCKISGHHGVVQELNETLAYPHFDFGNSFCTG